jgi:uncharacterized DUF497 family protein
MKFVRKLIWDEWNVTHIARHGVTPNEVEKVCHNNPFMSESVKGRTRAIGQSQPGRTLTVILAPKDKRAFYPVTARPASRKERRRYQELKGGEI